MQLINRKIVISDNTIECIFITAIIVISIIYDHGFDQLDYKHLTDAKYNST